MIPHAKSRRLCRALPVSTLPIMDVFGVWSWRRLIVCMSQKRGREVDPDEIRSDPVLCQVSMAVPESLEGGLGR